MSIQDRDWYSREVLRKLGIRKDGEPDPDPSAGPFGINNRHKKRKIREQRRAWVRLVLVVLVAAGVGGGLFVYLVKIISSR